MKIAFESPIPASMEAVWNILTDFSKYPEWNPILIQVEGNAGLDSILKMTVKLSGTVPRSIEALVTGYTAPRYFSFESRHRFGEWFYHEEWILRMKERTGGGVTFIAEAFVTGLSLRFRRSKVEGAFRRTLFNFVDALKERVGNRALSV